MASASFSFSWAEEFVHEAIMAIIAIKPEK
jgi:hypothetical protein